MCNVLWKWIYLEDWEVYCRGSRISSITYQFQLSLMYCINIYDWTTKDLMFGQNSRMLTIIYNGLDPYQILYWLMASTDWYKTKVMPIFVKILFTRNKKPHSLRSLFDVNVPDIDLYFYTCKKVKYWWMWGWLVCKCLSSRSIKTTSEEL